MQTPTLFQAYAKGFAAHQFVLDNNVPMAEAYSEGQRFSVGKGFHTESGFTIELPQSDEVKVDQEIICDFIETNAKWLARLRDFKIFKGFSFGLLVGSKASYIAFLEIDAKTIAKMAIYDLGLTVAGYPHGDDDK